MNKLGDKNEFWFKNTPRSSFAKEVYCIQFFSKEQESYSFLFKITKKCKVLKQVSFSKIIIIIKSMYMHTILFNELYL